jgi:hypothetical protein
MPKQFFMICIILFLAGCAAQAPPGGGPEDKTPPELIRTDPPDESVNLAENQSLTFYFSETISAASVRTGFTLFPLNTTETRLKIRRKRVTVTPVDGWNENRVYSLVFDRNIQDLRGNVMDKAIVFTFSTGNVIPEGEISGGVPNYRSDDRILIGLAQGAWRPDSVFNHLSYLTETNREGKYRFRSIPPGDYTLAGIVDHDRSKSYSPDFDDLVFPEKLTMTMTDSARIQTDLYVVRGHFLPMKYISGQNIFPSMTRLRFTKVPSKDIRTQDFIVNEIPVDTFRIEEKDLFLYHQTVYDSLFTVRTNTLKDTLGVEAGPFTDTLKMKAYTDTLGRIRWEDNCLVVEPPVRPDSLRVTAMTGTDTTERFMVPRFPGRFGPSHSWKGRDFSGKLAVRIPLSEAYPSILQWTDTVTVRYQAESDSGRFILHVLDMDEKQVGFILSGKKGRYEKSVSPPGTCIFENVFAGEYSLWYYPDRNGNGRQDFGWVWPYSPPEIARPLLKEIQIRARWDTETDLHIDSDE